MRKKFILYCEREIFSRIYPKLLFRDNRKFKRSRQFLTVYSVLLTLAAIIFWPLPAFAQQSPGDASDPLVTRQYVDRIIEELLARIAVLEGIIASIDLDSAPQLQATEPSDDFLPSHLADFFGDRNQNATTQLFEIRHVAEGHTVIFEAGAELILRTGDAFAVAGANGLIDVTAGSDVANGERISHNHLLLVPQADGRGLFFQSSGWIMIKGGYTIAE